MWGMTAIMRLNYLQDVLFPFYLDMVNRTGHATGRFTGEDLQRFSGLDFGTNRARIASARNRGYIRNADEKRKRGNSGGYEATQWKFTEKMWTLAERHYEREGALA